MLLAACLGALSLAVGWPGQLSPAPVKVLNAPPPSPTTAPPPPPPTTTTTTPTPTPPPAAARSPSSPSLAVMQVRAVGTSADFAGLASLVASTASQYRVRVIAPSDVIALLDHEQEKLLMGCTEQSCLAEIGRAMGVDYLLVPEVSTVGGVWIVSLTLLHATELASAGRGTERVDRQEQIVDVASTLVHQVMRGTFPRAGGPFTLAGTGTGTGSGSGSGVDGDVPALGVVLGGLGATLVVGAAVTGLLALDAASRARTLSTSPDRAAFDEAKGTATSLAAVTDIAFVAGVAAAGAGAFVILAR